MRTIDMLRLLRKLPVDDADAALQQRKQKTSLELMVARVLAKVPDVK